MSTPQALTPRVPLFAPVSASLGTLGRVQRVLESGSFVNGDELATFEDAFARYTNCDYAIGVNSGTDALTILLRAHGITGDVIVPALTFAATAESVIHAGARPVFCDVGDEYTLTPETVDEVWTRDTEAVVAVHLFGNPAPQIKAPLVLEDAAQAAGAAGICRNSAAFSFYPSKNLPCAGDGGAIVTDDPAIAARAHTLRSHGRIEDRHEFVGYTSRLDEVQAAVLNAQLPKLPYWTSRRLYIAARYDEVLGERSMRRPPGSCLHLYVIEVDNRDELRERLAAAGVETGVYYSPPLHKQPAFKQYADGKLPNAERIAKRMLCLPMGPALTDHQVEFVCQLLKETT